MNNRGFTLIELAVVVFLVGTMMLLAVPVVRETLVADTLKTSVNRIVNTAHHLRNTSLREQVDGMLHFDMTRGMIWITTADMTPEAVREEKKRAFQLPQEIRIVDVHRFGGEKIQEGEVSIRFYSRGYRDPTVVHLARSNQFFTLIFEPFLPNIAVHEGYRDYEHSR